MCAASSAIREKPLWWQKFKDPAIAAKWEQEILDWVAPRAEATGAAVHEDSIQIDLVHEDFVMGEDNEDTVEGDSNSVEEESNANDEEPNDDNDEDNDEGNDEDSDEWSDEEYDGDLPYANLEKEHVRFIFQELEWYADQRLQQTSKGIEAPIERAIDGTRRSDGLVPVELKERLLTCVQKLIDVPEHLKDWHPGSNKQVLDLVHPSLFPAIVGETRITAEPAIPALEFIGRGTVLKAEDLPPAPERRFNKFFSKQYQWLPTDFSVSSEGKVKIKSYINNLHPVEHAEMYPVLEEIFGKFLPMFEEVLGEMQDIFDRPHRLSVGCDWYEKRSEDQNVPYGDRDRAYYRRMDRWLRTRIPEPVKIPETFVAPPAVQPFNLKLDCPLQVIVKLANIELTPENPTYSGGSWHVEGMMNENIVATGIYYYHSENVTDTRLNFRIGVREPNYEQNDDRGCKIMYDLEDSEALSQPLDGMVTKQDRCIVFPNIYQHQVQPFELEDKTRSGTRQILVFFLVNPQLEVLSTTNVPPQQKDWAMSAGMMDEVASRLPPEIFQQVDDFLDWPMTLEEAKKHREALMEERKFFVDSTNREMFERPFSLCEH